MKKLSAILLSAIMAVSLAACSGSNGTGGGSGGSAGGSATSENTSGTETAGTERSETPAAEASETTAQAPAAETNGEPGEEPTGESGAETAGESNAEPAGGKTLVVYYSATNNTEAVAGYIADATGADLFELVPVEPYTSDDLNWTDRDSRVSREHDDESLRVVELENAVPDNWDEYDTVFIGYPIWWGIAAWPVGGFISANDFTGKTVIPFCTSSSSGLGQSGELLRDAAGTGDWLEGQRFQSRADEDTVKEWVASLEL